VPPGSLRLAAQKNVSSKGQKDRFFSILLQKQKHTALPLGLKKSKML